MLDRVGLVHATHPGREKHFRIDQAQLARAVVQLSEVGTAWDGRLRRTKKFAEVIDRSWKG